MSRAKVKPDFDQILSQAIDTALSSLGEGPRKAIYHHLENGYEITKEEIPQRLADFSNALDKIFGFGARNLEILFMKHLHAEIKNTFEEITGEWMVPSLTFQEYVSLVRRNFEACKNETRTECFVDEREKQEQFI